MKLKKLSVLIVVLVSVFFICSTASAEIIECQILQVHSTPTTGDTLVFVQQVGNTTNRGYVAILNAHTGNNISVATVLTALSLGQNVRVNITPPTTLSLTVPKTAWSIGVIAP